MSQLKTYAFWHLNLAFSSIEEKERPRVISECYWPLIRLAKDTGIPFGLEMTGFTLEKIAELDPKLLEEIRDLIRTNQCELVGSGYVQLIGPLVPPEVTRANLSLGNSIYRNIFDKTPSIALINEQAYSAGIVPLYLDAGFKAVIMEWNNPARCHALWPPEFGWKPQRARGNDGRDIAIIWNDSVAFQKFQYYAHGEISMEEYQSFLTAQLRNEPRFFSLYGSDAEIFNFRPKRFEEESEVQSNEWQRIRQLFDSLAEDCRTEWVSFYEVLKALDDAGSGITLQLESADQPIPVKKQGKYNVARWAVTGRGDPLINTMCNRILASLQSKSETPLLSAELQELCYLWSSDFRTHTTPKRWEEYCKRILASSQSTTGKFSVVEDPNLEPNHSTDRVRVSEDAQMICLENQMLKLQLSKKRGLSVRQLQFPSIGGNWVLGSIPHGYYDDIDWAEDFSSGYMVLNAPSHPNVTDLHPGTSWIEQNTTHADACFSMDTTLGPLRKRIRVTAGSPSIETLYELDWEELPAGSLRFGNLTINPVFFDPDSLSYATCNGGEAAEHFPLDRCFNHGKAASFLVSSSQGLGMSSGNITIGDRRGGIEVSHDRYSLAMIGLLTYTRVGRLPFLRFSFSAREMDETCRSIRLRNGPLGNWPLCISYSISPYGKNPIPSPSEP